MSYSEWIGIKLVVMQTYQLLIISYVHTTQCTHTHTHTHIYIHTHTYMYVYVYVYVFIGVWIYDFYILCQGQYVGFGHI